MAYSAWRIPSRRTVGLGMLVDSEEAPWFLSHQGIDRRYRTLRDAKERAEDLLARPDLDAESRTDLESCVREVRILMNEARAAALELTRREALQEDHTR
jgi:hypothetical protein